MDARFALLASALPPIAKEAGRIIMDVRAGGFLAVQEKTTYGKTSPYTLADTASHHYLTDILGGLSFGKFPVVSEENNLEYNSRIIDENETFWLIDPLDGTTSFIKGRDDFAVNIALIHKGKPILGAVYFPAHKQLYYTAGNNNAYRQDGEEDTPVLIKARTARLGENAIIAAGYKDNQDDYRRLGIEGIIGDKEPLRITNALRICRTAQGDAHLAIGTKYVSTWDIAAPDAVLRAAGGMLVNLKTNQPMTYGAEANVTMNGLTYLLATPPFIGGHCQTLANILHTRPEPTNQYQR